MSPTDPVAPRTVTELATAQLAAYNAADLDAFCACYHADVTVLGADGDVRFSGLAAFRERYGALFRDFTEVRGTVDERVTLGSHVIEREAWSRVERATGARTSGTVLVRYTEADGLLRWAQFFT
jgi:uncharacterized protein (TIGR02246 family)